MEDDASMCLASVRGDVHHVNKYQTIVCKQTNQPAFRLEQPTFSCTLNDTSVGCIHLRDEYMVNLKMTKMQPSKEVSYKIRRTCKTNDYYYCCWYYYY